MRKFQTLLVVSAFACAPAALAQETTIIVDLSGISADLATQLEVEITQLPTTVTLSPEFAAVVCGVDAGSLTDSCTAVTSSAELTAQIESELEGDDEGETSSAAAFAPGHQEGKARDFAPGQQEGPATDYAPGQVKKDDGETGSDLDDDNGNSSNASDARDSAPGHQGGHASDHAPGQDKQDNDGGDTEDSGSPSDDAPGQNK